MNEIRKDAEQVIKANDAPPTVRAIAMALLNAGQPVYYCTIGGVKTAVIK